MSTKMIEIIEYDEIEDLEPGARIRINNEEYVRMTDSIGHHLEGFICNINTGIWNHYSAFRGRIEVMG